MLIVASKVVKSSLFSLHWRSDIPNKWSSSEEITSVKLSREYMAFSTRLKDGTSFLFGNRFSTASTTCPWSQSLMKKLCVCMAESQKTFSQWNRLKGSPSLAMSQTPALSQICFGMIPMRIAMAGKRMREDVAGSSATSSFNNFYKNTILIWYAGAIKSWKMVMDSLEKINNLLQFLALKIIAGILTMMPPWWM